MCITLAVVVQQRQEIPYRLAGAGFPFPRRVGLDPRTARRPRSRGCCRSRADVGTRERAPRTTGEGKCDVQRLDLVAERAEGCNQERLSADADPATVRRSTPCPCVWPTMSPHIEDAPGDLWRLPNPHRTAPARTTAAGRRLAAGAVLVSSVGIKIIRRKLRPVVTLRRRYGIKTMFRDDRDLLPLTQTPPIT